MQKSINSRKFLGEDALFDDKVCGYLWPNREGTLKPDCFYCDYDILTQTCFMKVLKAFHFVSVQNENKYWTLGSFCEIRNAGFLFIFLHILDIFQGTFLSGFSCNMKFFIIQRVKQKSYAIFKPYLRLWNREEVKDTHCKGKVLCLGIKIYFT